MDDGVGARLREVRIQRGIDLAEVEASTKIRAKFLRAIEDEAWDLLPGEFYAHSFIRAYAAHLRLDGAQLVEELPSAPSPDVSAERLPRIEPAPPREAHAVRRNRLSLRRPAAIATLALAAALVAVGLSSLGDDSTGPSPARDSGGGERHQPGPSSSEQSPGRGTGATLALTATAEVWVCLIDERGRTLIDGQILDPGSEAGPYRSGAFTVALGNGAVAMSIEGQAARIPSTPNPIGFSIDGHGTLRQLPEGERPTCT